jgi:lipid-A-disaccharide synthase
MQQDTSPEIIFLAGEVSGDIYSARLARLLRERNPGWRLHALGGPHLGRAVNGEWIGDTSHCSAIGICSAAMIYPRGKLLSWRLHKFVRQRRIAAAVLCDWGYFNCAQLKFLRSQGVPVLYFFPPRSWQRAGTAGLGIAPLVTRAATPFEWSARRLNAAGCDADWVGHPLIEELALNPDRAALRAEFGAADGARLVALFPGSRRPELHVLAPRLAAAANILRLKHHTAFVAAVPAELAPLARKYFPAWVKVVSERSADVLAACDAALVKAGTVTLEAAVLGAPQVIIYDLDWSRRFEWLFLWSWKRIPFVGMPNIILQRMAVPELLGLDCRAEAMAFAVEELLTNEVQRGKMMNDYEEIRRAIGSELGEAPTVRVAGIVEGMVRGETAEEDKNRLDRETERPPVAASPLAGILP